jgi:hypothetical protein
MGNRKHERKREIRKIKIKTKKDGSNEMAKCKY